MKNTTLAFLCCSAFLAACDNSSDNTGEKEISSTAVDKTSAMIASVGDDGNKGETIYKKHCVACHGTGVVGSPKLGDKTAWSARITQGNEVLSQHAIKGYKGETGYMPPKGGFMALSDEEISQTVMYMVSQVQ